MKSKNIEDSLRDLSKRFSKSKTKASILINDKEKTKRKIDEAFNKANANKADLQNVWTQFELLFSLIKDYFNGTYKEVPKKSVIAIVAGLLYFLSPMDMIPDFLLGFGLIDDVFIIGLVIKQVTRDLTKYKDWKTKETSVY